MNTYGKLLREIRFMDKRFGKIAFGEDNQPIRSSYHFKRFVTDENLVNVIGLMSEFYVMLNGFDSYKPFNIRSLFEIDSAYCKGEVVRGLEETQLKLIYMWNFVSRHLNTSKADNKRVNDMIKAWRLKQTKLLKKFCKDESDLKDLSLLAKFIAAEC